MWFKFFWIYGNEIWIFWVQYSILLLPNSIQHYIRLTHHIEMFFFTHLRFRLPESQTFVGGNVVTRKTVIKNFRCPQNTERERENWTTDNLCSIMVANVPLIIMYTNVKYMKFDLNVYSVVPRNKYLTIFEWTLSTA